MNVPHHQYTEDDFPILSDGSSFFTGSFALPKDHWLYVPRSEEWNNERDCSAELPNPILTHEFRQQVTAAAEYAVRAATNNGTVMDFDPDALVQSMVVALCGFYDEVQSK